MSNETYCNIKAFFNCSGYHQHSVSTRVAKGRNMDNTVPVG
jgi:hypothetical protein